MSKVSIKFRVTLFYASVLIIITLFLSAFFLVTLNLEIYNISKTALETTVKEAFDNVKSESDWLDISSNIDLYVHDVSLVFYGAGGMLILGSPPADFPQSVPLISDTHQSLKTKSENWQVYDSYFEYPNGTGLWIRGIYSLRNNMESFNGVLQIMSVGLPVVLIVAIFFGYLVTRQAFSPISRIQKTAEEIAQSQDLSKRIALVSGKKDELYNLSQTFDSMFEQIESAFNNEKQFSSDVSHELRTPVSIIISQSEYGLSEHLTIEEYKKCLETILIQSEKMSLLINSLLEISRVMNSKNILIKESLNFADLCDVVIEEMTEKAEEKSIRLITKLDRKITIKGDQTQLLRLVINLISNAITHGKENGFVMVELYTDNGRIILSVSDDGIGIAPEHIKNIFIRFFQINPDKTALSSSNSGLGLSMVKMIAEAHGGNVKVKSTLGVGSTFIVSFPG
ncbi:MAG: sensor histidine kinase [Saccharofermentanales bacterium]